MGASYSSNTQEATNQFLTEITNNVIVRNNQEVSASNVNVNSSSFKHAKIKNCKDFVIGQTITATTVASGKLDSQTTVNIATSIKNALENLIDQENKTQNLGLFSGAFRADTTKNTVKLKNEIKNILKNTFESSTYQKVVSQANNLNYSDLQGFEYTCPDGGSFKVTQDIFSKVTAQGVSTAVTNALFQNDIVNSAVNNTLQKNSIKNTGLTIGLVIAAIVLILIVYFLYRKFSGQGMQPQGSSAK